MTKVPPLVLAVDDSVELRLQTVDDAEIEWSLVSANLEYLSKWVEWATPDYTFTQVQSDMADNLSKFESGQMYAMGIYVNDELVGNVDVRNIEDGKSAEVGYLLAESFTGRGIMTKCVQALMNFAQAKHDIRTFYLNTYIDNQASRKLAERLGFVLKSDHRAANGKTECYCEKKEN